MSPLVRHLIALAVIGLGAAALVGGTTTAQEPPIQYNALGEIIRLPEVLPLPRIEDDWPRPLPKVDEKPAEGAETEEEEVAGLVDIDLLPEEEELAILAKGEEALLAIEEFTYFESWLMRPLQLWSASFEFGINGSSGNNDIMDLRFGSHARRVTDHLKFTADLTYKTVTQNGDTISDRLFTEARNEWLSEDSPWMPYVHGSYEYDAFRAFDARMAGDAGIGYQVFKTGYSTFLARAGAGLSYELNEPDSILTWEGAWGLDFERRLTQRQKFAASIDYFPGWANFGTYRINSKASWEVNLDSEGSLSLKLSVNNRYDSTPDGVEPNDLDYAATLLWSF